MGEQVRNEMTRPEADVGPVATNLLRDRARLAARRARERHDMLDENRVSSPDPHQLLEARDTLARLAQAVGTLSLRRQRIFLIHRREHLTYAAIAKETVQREKGVEKTMDKALMELRRELAR